MKRIIRRLLAAAGYDIRRLATELSVPAATNRPIGKIDLFLHDVKARGFSPKLVLDVGANRGNWTRMAKQVFPDAAFFLIEPQFEMRDSLNKLCSEYHDVQWLEAGASSCQETRVLTIWEDLGGSSFLPPVREELLTVDRQRQITMTTIDSALASRNLGAPDLVKLDVQGFELEALRGANSIFYHTELFVIETSLYRYMPHQPLTRDVIAFMEERGYEFYDVTEYLRRPLDGALGQIDLAFAKRAGLLRQSDGW